MHQLNQTCVVLFEAICKFRRGLRENIDGFISCLFFFSLSCNVHPSPKQDDDGDDDDEDDVIEVELQEDNDEGDEEEEEDSDDGEGEEADPNGPTMAQLMSGQYVRRNTMLYTLYIPSLV